MNIESRDLPKSWGSTFFMQAAMGEFAADKLHGDVTIKSVFRKVHKEMAELGTVLKDGEYDPEKLDLGKLTEEMADVILPLLLIGHMVGRDIGIIARRKIDTCMKREWEKQPDGTWQHIEDPAEEADA